MEYDRSNKSNMDGSVDGVDGVDGVDDVMNGSRSRSGVRHVPYGRVFDLHGHVYRDLDRIGIARVELQRRLNCKQRTWETPMSVFRGAPRSSPST
jgi:hypothetical protein